jgi:hypothetical protein
VKISAPPKWRELFVVVILLASPVSAQNQAENPQAPPAQPPTAGQPQPPADGQGGADSNPLKVVLLQLRNEYYHLNDGNWQNALLIRSDKVVLKKGRWGGKLGVMTRVDIPIMTAEIDSATHAGLGDVYGQFTEVPFLTPQFGLFAGTGLSVPSATYKTLGTGKWTIAPLGGPVYFFGRRRGLAFIKVQEYLSFAGDSTRPDIKYLLVTPLVMWNFNRMTWMEFLEESHTDHLNSNSTWFKAGIKLGHMFNRKVGAWVMPEVLWGESRPGNFNLKFSLVWNR